MNDLHKAVELLSAGDWEAAHLIVQEDATPEGCWAHGIVHLMEGDLDNAGYWYRKAGRAMATPECIDDEIAALRDRISPC